MSLVSILISVKKLIFLIHTICSGEEIQKHHSTYLFIPWPLFPASPNGNRREKSGLGMKLKKFSAAGWVRLNSLLRNPPNTNVGRQRLIFCLHFSQGPLA